MFVGIIASARTVWGDDAHWGSNVRRVVCFRMDAIAWGFLLHILVRRSLPVERLPATALLVGFCVIAGAALFVTYQIAQGSVPLIAHAFPFYAPALGAAAILLALKLEDAIECRSALSAAGLFLGRMSYSVYLFHLLALAAIIPLTSHLPIALSFAAFLLLTGMIASLMAVAVEVPILAARPRFKK